MSISLGDNEMEATTEEMPCQVCGVKGKKERFIALSFK